MKHKLITGITIGDALVLAEIIGAFIRADTSKAIHKSVKAHYQELQRKSLYVDA